MKKLLLAICLASLSLDAARAKDAVTTVELKRKSSFDAGDARDPFWPIGWKKPGPKIGGGTSLAPEAFSLTSVTVGSGTHFAILNGKIMQEGQQFGLQIGNQIYQITLRAIEDGRVIVAYEDSEIVVPLRRK
ncbi:MAG: hypothetical protein WCE51_08490 [Chthoniobacterales bacterium]|jgi:hypothetical protein